MFVVVTTTYTNTWYYLQYYTKQCSVVLVEYDTFLPFSSSSTVSSIHVCGYKCTCFIITSTVVGFVLVLLWLQLQFGLLRVTGCAGCGLRLHLMCVSVSLSLSLSLFLSLSLSLCLSFLYLYCVCVCVFIYICICICICICLPSRYLWKPYGLIFDLVFFQA